MDRRMNIWNYKMASLREKKYLICFYSVLSKDYKQVTVLKNMLTDQDINIGINLI